MGNCLSLFRGKGVSIYLKLMDDGKVKHYCKLLSVGGLRYSDRETHSIQKSTWIPNNQSISNGGVICGTSYSRNSINYSGFSYGTASYYTEESYSIIGYGVFIKIIPSWCLVNKKCFDIEDWGYVGDIKTEIVISYSEVGKIFNSLCMKEYGEDYVKN